MEDTVKKLNLEPEKNEEPDNPKKRFLTILLSFSIVIIAFVVFNITMHPIAVSGRSMEPTFYSGQFLFMDVVDEDTVLEKGNVVVVKDGFIQLIKRIVGTPGDRLEVIGGRLYVNGTLDERYEKIENPGILSSPIVLSDDQYFCIGDNVNHSEDCRVIGAVSKSQILYRTKEGYP